MSVTRIYSCNLCRDAREPKDLIGLYWDTNSRVRTEAPCAVEHHICLLCLASLRAIAIPQPPFSKPSPANLEKP